MSSVDDIGVIEAGNGLDGIEWHILGQTYTPKQLTDESFAWHATLPPGTFVPPHVHPTQHEYLYILEGTLDFWLEGETVSAGPGAMARLVKGKPHGIFNNSDAVANCLFWVAPTRRLYDLFVGLDGLDPQTPESVSALSAEHEVEFLPPSE